MGYGLPDDLFAADQHDISCMCETFSAAGHFIAMETVGNRSKARDALDATSLKRSLLDHIEQADFPCVGAKSAFATGNLRVETARSLTSAWNDLEIHQALLDWSHDYSCDPTGLRSLAFIFEGPLDLTETEFEAAMWDRLQSLACKDDWLGQNYDPSVSSDPSDPHFSMSFGGRGYFVIGLHPNASRSARRTPFPTLIFNLHDQFERLRAEQRYERMREVILKRDFELDGSNNPMIARHGKESEARQYSGRQVTSDWQCPFTDPRRNP